MPLVTINVLEGVFTDEQKLELIARVTDAMVSVEGEAMRPITWVMIAEVRRNHWGIGGQSIVGGQRSTAGTPRKGDHARGPVRLETKLRRRTFMSYEQSVSDHYLHGNLLAAIEAAIPRLGKSVSEVTVEDLGPVDEFHIGGRVATDRLLRQLNFTERDHVLDVGCGLGGASRFIADRYRSRVTGIDLTQEYIETGKALCGWVGLDGRVSLHQGNALDMPFENASFDGALMLHVGMNIGDKDRLFREICRVLRPGAVLGVYDVMRTSDGELTYPVPWASDVGTSKLATVDRYRKALLDAGFDCQVEDDRRDFALEFFKQMKARTESTGGSPPLGLHTLMQKATPVKLQNMVGAIAAGLIAPVEMIARKPAIS